MVVAFLFVFLNVSSFAAQCQFAGGGNHYGSKLLPKRIKGICQVS